MVRCSSEHLQTHNARCTYIIHYTIYFANVFTPHLSYEYGQLHARFRVSERFPVLIPVLCLTKCTIHKSEQKSQIKKGVVFKVCSLRNNSIGMLNIILSRCRIAFKAILIVLNVWVISITINSIRYILVPAQWFLHSESHFNMTNLCKVEN